MSCCSGDLCPDSPDPPERARGLRWGHPGPLPSLPQHCRVGWLLPRSPNTGIGWASSQASPLSPGGPRRSRPPPSAPSRAQPPQARLPGPVTLTGPPCCPFHRLELGRSIPEARRKSTEASSRDPRGRPPEACAGHTRVGRRMFIMVIITGANRSHARYRLCALCTHPLI